ncbi:hypothetical protein CH25_gp64 [Mycobacterium phage EagleEye]|uniref:Uncharacterized protein n=1 Tax=Mycobacterium phage EagleEye TaxID=1429759 RepID=W0LN05_9CAUD|nr:hypothetical protein CH25_gp64 [Mycobacterium phage EagleEye]AHG23822.1 hypothetical protein PBI_EAGLEEYE_42 [Mycobacterium phage EagleEye]
MKISEVVAKLVHIKDEHGDVDVEYLNSCCCYGDWHEEVGSVDVSQNEGYKPSVLLI